jgi:hypothetical protein
VGKNSGSRPTRLTIEIYRDVDFRFAYLGSDLGIAQSLYFDEAVEGSFDPPAHRASVVGAKRNRRSVEPRSIVMLEHAGDQDRSCVIVEFCGEVRNPDPVMAVAFAAP